MSEERVVGSFGNTLYWIVNDTREDVGVCARYAGVTLPGTLGVALWGLPEEERDAMDCLARAWEGREVPAAAVACVARAAEAVRARRRLLQKVHARPLVEKDMPTQRGLLIHDEQWWCCHTKAWSIKRWLLYVDGVYLCSSEELRELWQKAKSQAVHVSGYGVAVVSGTTDTCICWCGIHDPAINLCADGEMVIHPKRAWALRIPAHELAAYLDTYVPGWKLSRRPAIDAAEAPANEEV